MTDAPKAEATLWPAGASCGVAFTFDFDAEAVWIGEDPANAHRPGVLSQGSYGAKVAVPLLLDLLARHDVKATFFVVGTVAERYPERVREIVAAGHEVAHHGYTHTSPLALSPDEEEAELVRGRDVLEAFGVPITGYRAPSCDVSPSTLGLLERHGFQWSSHLMDDIRPYVHPGTSIVELPVQWILGDAAHFWFGPADWARKISTATQVREIWQEELLGIRALGGLCVFVLHPQIVGRPGRLGLLGSLLGFVQELGDVWTATCGEIAGRFHRGG